MAPQLRGAQQQVEASRHLAAERQQAARRLAAEQAKADEARVAAQKSPPPAAQKLDYLAARTDHFPALFTGLQPTSKNGPANRLTVAGAHYILPGLRPVKRPGVSKRTARYLKHRDAAPHAIGLGIITIGTFPQRDTLGLTVVKPSQRKSILGVEQLTYVLGNYLFHLVTEQGQLNVG